MAEELSAESKAKLDAFMQELKEQKPLGEKTAGIVSNIGTALYIENIKDAYGGGQITEENEALLIAKLNADADGAIETARQNIAKNPSALAEAEKNPNYLTTLIGASQTQPKAPAAEASVAAAEPVAEPAAERNQADKPNAVEVVAAAGVSSKRGAEEKPVQAEVEKDSVATKAGPETSHPMSSQQLTVALVEVLNKEQGQYFMKTIQSDPALRRTVENVAGVDFDQFKTDEDGLPDVKEINAAIDGMDQEHRDNLEVLVKSTQDDPEYLGKMADSMNDMSPQLKGSMARMSEHHPGMAMMMATMPMMMGGISSGLSELGLGNIDLGGMMNSMMTFLGPLLEKLIGVFDKVSPGLKKMGTEINKIGDQFNNALGMKDLKESRQLASAGNSNGELTKQALQNVGTDPDKVAINQYGQDGKPQAPGADATPKLDQPGPSPQELNGPAMVG